MSTSNKNQEN